MASPGIIKRPQFSWLCGVEELEGVVEHRELLGDVERFA